MLVGSEPSLVGDAHSAQAKPSRDVHVSDVLFHTIARKHSGTQRWAGAWSAHHKQTFLDNVLIYVALAFGTSVLSALRQLCFTIVARRVVLHIRGRVFESILQQDIVSHAMESNPWTYPASTSPLSSHKVRCSSARVDRRSLTACARATCSSARPPT